MFKRGGDETEILALFPMVYLHDGDLLGCTIILVILHIWMDDDLSFLTRIKSGVHVT